MRIAGTLERRKVVLVSPDHIGRQRQSLEVLSLERHFPICRGECLERIRPGTFPVRLAG
jgi:hypothetical protein